MILFVVCEVILYSCVISLQKTFTSMQDFKLEFIKKQFADNKLKCKL